MLVAGGFSPEFITNKNVFKTDMVTKETGNSKKKSKRHSLKLTVVSSTASCNPKTAPESDQATTPFSVWTNSCISP